MEAFLKPLPAVLLTSSTQQSTLESTPTQTTISRKAYKAICACHLIQWLHRLIV